MPEVECFWRESTQSTQVSIHLVILYCECYFLKSIFLLRLLNHDNSALINIGVPKKPCTLKTSMRTVIWIDRELMLESIKLEIPIS